MNNDARYTSYQNMVTQVNTGLVQMQKAAARMNLEETAKQLEASREKLERRKFAVGILREFRRGKKYSNQFPSGEGNYAVGYPSDFGYDESGNL